MGFRVYGLGFGVWGMGFGVWGLELRGGIESSVLEARVRHEEFREESCLNIRSPFWNPKP